MRFDPSVCFECGKAATQTHHVVPQSKGGTQTVPICDGCHGKVHGTSMHIVELTCTAMAHKKAKGERVGQLPFGFDVDADGVTLVPNENETRIIELINSLRMKGYSYRAIAAEMDAVGVATKKGTGKWNHKTVASILNRTAATRR